MRHYCLAALIGVSTVFPLPALAAQRDVTLRAEASDLATFAEGTFVGDVISDSRGSSRAGVTVRVTRVGSNLVEVRCDYARVPTVRIQLESAMNAVVAAGGDNVFLINRDQDPDRLELTIDGASLSLTRQ